MGSDSTQAFMLMSSELPERINLSSRTLAMREGQVAEGLSRSDATQDNVLRLMTGVTSAAKAT